MLTNSVPGFLSIWAGRIAVHLQEDDPAATVILDRLTYRLRTSRQPACRLLNGFFVFGLDKNEIRSRGQIADRAYVNNRSPQIKQERQYILCAWPDGDL